MKYNFRISMGIITAVFCVLFLMGVGTLTPSAIYAQGSTPGRAFGDVLKTSENLKLEGTLFVPPNPQLTKPFKGGGNTAPLPTLAPLSPRSWIDLLSAIIQVLLKWLILFP